MGSPLFTIRPIHQLGTTWKRALHYVGWLALLTLISFAMSLLGLQATAISIAVSLVILTYLLVRRNVLDISLDTEKKLLLVRYLPWFGKPRTKAYTLSATTEVGLIPANAKVPFKGEHWTGRYKLVIKNPTWYELEFFTSDFSTSDLRALQRGITEALQA